MQEYYKALGLNENATDEQVDKAYSALKAKYSKDRFLEGEEGNDAARKLTFLEVAYKEIKESRAGSFDSTGNSSFEEVEKHVSVGGTKIEIRASRAKVLLVVKALEPNFQFPVNDKIVEEIVRLL